MENNYRDMMDAVKAPEGLRMEVRNMSEQERTKKTRPLPVRVALAAACICALLATAAIAAETLGFDFVKIFNKEEAEETDLDYMVDGSGVKHIPLSALSQEAQALKEQYEDRDDGYVCTVELAFDSWEEAEEYLGYEIMDNPVLARGTYGSVSLLSKEGDERSANCWIKVIFGDDGEITYIQVFSRMNLSASPNGYMVEATLYMRAIEDRPKDPTVAYKYPDDSHVEGTEDYLTPDGLETVIVNIERGDRGGEYNAHFFLRGIQFRVGTYYPAEEQEAALTELKQVLDAFE
ncbi:MAG: hypothetical protein J6J87_05845 [Oscillospiraceae bacterium]|nr:hypothetical protein [Oscillospiraceae bacterium]